MILKKCRRLFYRNLMQNRKIFQKDIKALIKHNFQNKLSNWNISNLNHTYKNQIPQIVKLLNSLKISWEK